MCCRRRLPPIIFLDFLYVPAVAVLQELVDEYEPTFVLTTSWLRLMDREACDGLLAQCDLAFLWERLHEQWEAPQVRGQTRFDAIQSWLRLNHGGESFVIIDDALSGTGLQESRYNKQGRVVLCEVNTGLLSEHLPRLRNALNNPAT